MTAPGAGATKVLLVEDDPRMASLVRDFLAQSGFEVELVADGARVMEALERRPVDVVLLDLMLPGLDGLEVCRRIRAEPRHAGVAILMVTARGDEVDRIVGLELGADDYLGKPYNPRELVARIRAVLRRGGARAPAPPEAERLVVGDLVIDLGARTVALAGRPITLTFFELELLVVLARANGRVLSREHLYDVLKGEAFESFDRSIDVHVSKLRAKLGDDPKAPRWIKTVRGVGYVLAKDGAAT